eukprot:2695680-Amphidinium_carterae.1
MRFKPRCWKAQHCMCDATQALAFLWDNPMMRQHMRLLEGSALHNMHLVAEPCDVRNTTLWLSPTRMQSAGNH